jgi:hypothetical protein
MSRLPNDEEERLHALVQEAHGVLRDLRLAIKEAKTLVAEEKTRTMDEYGEVVRQGLEEFQEALGIATEDATQAVYDRFDLIAAILLGKDWESQREGRAPLDELVRRYIERRGRGTASEARPTNAV